MVLILAEAVTEIQIGRPGSGTAFAIVIAFIAGPVCAFAGAVIGGVVWAIVRRTRWAGPADFRIMAIVALLSVGVSAGVGVLSVVLRSHCGTRWTRRLAGASGSVASDGQARSIADLRSRRKADARGTS